MAHSSVNPLILILISLSQIQNNDGALYYIKTTENETCPTPSQQCLTLSAFSTSGSSDVNTALIMLPGEHSLNVNISISNVENITMYSLTDISATITCVSSSRFSFDSIALVSIRNVNFMGCGGNMVNDVSEFLLQEVTFRGQPDSGTALTLINTHAEIIDSTFVDYQFGTVMESVESLKVLTTNVVWLIVRNVTGIVRVGGVFISTQSNITISQCRFENNTADIGGDLFTEGGSKISIFNSTFVGDGPQPSSDETAFGGAIYSHQSDISVRSSRFREKHATSGASIASSSSQITINGTDFISNSASDHGAALFAYNSSVYIYGSNFDKNMAGGGAGVGTDEGDITVEASVFTSNIARWHGAALDFYLDTSTVIGCHFENNAAYSFGGALLFWFSNGRMFGQTFTDGSMQSCYQESESDIQRYCYGDNSRYPLAEYVRNQSGLVVGDRISFISNSAPTGAALYVIKSTVQSCGPVILSENTATLNSNVYILNSVGKFEGSILMMNNVGSFFAFNSNITFSGCIAVLNSTSPRDSTTSFKEGGALTLYQTTLYLQGRSRLENNRAEIGGAIVGTECEIVLNSNAKIDITNNTATKSGGGLYLSQSDLYGLEASALTISNNTANDRGGGIHAISSSIKLTVTGSKDTDAGGNVYEQYQSSVLNITENKAIAGGAIFLEANSKLTLLKDYIFEATTNRSAVNFVGNSARYGGAVYVDDASNTESCLSNPFNTTSSKSECFLNVVSTQTVVTVNTNFSLKNVLFDQNLAAVSGSTLFGGLLDRCIVSPFNEVDRTIDQTTNELLSYKGDGLKYMLDISSGHTNQSISSYPVKVCSCVNGRQDCRYNFQARTEVRKGHPFNVTVIAVDQVYRPVNAIIAGYLRSLQGNLIRGQVTRIPNECTNVSFSIVSPDDSVDLVLFASDGPCKDVELSRLNVGVTFLPCSCPIGFEQSSMDNTVCSCECHMQISLYVARCNSTTRTFQRDVNVWISYVNETSYSGYLVHKYCPFDYCVPPNMSQPLNLNLPDGEDTQCALNRRGMLCGACKPGLTLSLGSSKCLECPDYWPALFVSITVFAILAGIGLVVLFLWLNITVAVGTLNGLLFYANIVAANRVALLPYPEPNFITVFISWLNLELGIDVCYIKGLDTYTKTWLQLAFPIYIIFLVALLIVVSQYSSRFSNIISKRNPVATLATLILISYGKLFHVILLAQPFSFAALTYPDGSKKLLWLPDGTVGYLAGKHIVLFIVALLILVVCIAYSFLLLCWQLILKLPNWKVFKFFKHPSFVLFMEAYHVPYTPKHRYWTGLLLLARAIIYLISAANISGDPQIQLVSIIFILSCIILLKMFIATKIFKKWLIDSLESFFYFNVIFLASFTAYNLSTGNNQDGIAYTSVVLSIVVTVFIVLYHVCAYSTPIVKEFCHRIIEAITNLKFRSQPDEKETRHYSITDDSISRYEDIIVLADDPNIKTGRYHSAEFDVIQNLGTPTTTSSVVEMS